MWWGIYRNSAPQVNSLSTPRPSSSDKTPQTISTHKKPATSKGNGLIIKEYQVVEASYIFKSSHFQGIVIKHAIDHIRGIAAVIGGQINII